MQPTQEVSSRDQRAAALAAHLAEGYREGKVEAVDVLRVLRHELRRRNTNSKMKIPRRSVEAQRVIDEYAQQGELPPKNGSADALHADHVFEINMNRPGSGGGCQSMEDESHGSTQEVPRRVA